jgi:hypothetical protein
VVCRNHLGAAYERQKESYITSKHAPQLRQWPARSDEGLSADGPCQFTAVVVCKNIWVQLMKDKKSLTSHKNMHHN